MMPIRMRAEPTRQEVVTPAVLWQQSGYDRTRYIELMKQNGFDVSFKSERYMCEEEQDLLKLLRESGM